MTDGEGVPIALTTTPANVPDGQLAVHLLDSIEPLYGRRGRPRKRPKYFLGDRGYGWQSNLDAVAKRGVIPVLARPGDNIHGSGLGRARWVVERTLSWFNNFRRLRLCYERSQESLLAFHEIAAALLCFRKLNAISNL